MGLTGSFWGLVKCEYSSSQSVGASADLKSLQQRARITCMKASGFTALAGWFFACIGLSFAMQHLGSKLASTRIKTTPKTSSAVVAYSQPPPGHALLPAVTNSNFGCSSVQPFTPPLQGLADSSCSPSCFQGIRELKSCKHLTVAQSLMSPIESACAKFVHNKCRGKCVDVGTQFIVKRYGVSKKKEFFSGLSRPESFHLERSALQRLEQTESKCNMCEERHLQSLVGAASHFPEGSKHLDMLLLQTENDGNAIDKSTQAQVQFCALGLEEVERQGQCMQQWLDCANVTHLDMRTKNFVVDEASKLTLIDFDFSCVDHKPLGKLTTRYQTPWERIGPVYFLRQLHQRRCTNGKVDASQQQRFKEDGNICLLMNKRRCKKCAYAFPFDW